MGIVISTHLPPPVMIESTERPQMGDPHVVLELGHVLFGGRLFGERPGQHEFGLEHGLGCPRRCRRGSPPSKGWPSASRGAAHLDSPAGIALVPVAVEVLGGRPELHDEIAGEVLRLGLAPFLAPEADQGGSSLPMMIRASEPPMKERRLSYCFVHTLDCTSSSSWIKNDVF